MSDDTHRVFGGRATRWGLGLGCVFLALFELAALNPWATERLYSRGLYPWIARLLSTLSALLPFSLGEWAYVVAIGGVFVAFGWGFFRARRAERGRGISMASGLTRALAWTGWCWSIFLLLWGFNYQRVRLVEQQDLQRVDEETREALIDAVGERLDLLRRGLPESDEGVAFMPPDLERLDAHLATLQSELLAELGWPRVSGGRTKVLASSPLLRRWGVSGVYAAFTGEPNVVLPAAPTRLPFTVAHERAHLAGVGPEDAANHIALLTVWRSERPEVRYSGWLALWTYLRVDPKGRHPGVLRDLRAIRRFLEEHRGREAPQVWRAYDRYLKAHGVKEGRRSYGRVARLALAWLAREGLPEEPLEVSGPGPTPGSPCRRRLAPRDGSSSGSCVRHRAAQPREGSPGRRRARRRRSR